MKKHIYFLFTILMLLILAGCNETSSKQEDEEQYAVTNNENTVQEQEQTDSTSSPAELKVHYIDVGQADATLLQVIEGDAEYTILIDAGDFTGDEVVNYLQAQNVQNIDIAIGTHPDADHIGQLADVLNQFQVGEVWLSGNTSQSETFQKLLTAIDVNDAGYEEPRMGDQYEVGPLAIEVLYPKDITGKTNEESISLKITYGDIRFIFTGDASVQNELDMVQNGLDLHADILHLGHHGSSTSTSQEFIAAVNPKTAIYSAGEGNSYGHPNGEVVKRVQNKGIELYGTDVHGTIIITTNGKEYSVHTANNGSIVPTENGTTAIESKNAAEEESPSPQINSCININSASLEEVEQIIHIGPERAQELIALRPYQSIEELSKIKGIGPARIADIGAEGLACVGG